MRLYRCEISGLPLYFESHFSVGANNAHVGFTADTLTLHTLEDAENGLWRIPSRPDTLWKFCQNAPLDGSNWLLSADDPNALSIPPRYNRAIPNTNTWQGIGRFHKLGTAQRHLFYSILRFGLPCPSRQDDPVNGLVFDFLEDLIDGNGNLVQAAVTGHEHGLISLRAAEADDDVREAARVAMREPYRTLLGHFRHEIGHFYWTQLVNDQQTLDAARRLFGDERVDYQAALQHHYAAGPPADWSKRFISSYASSHPAEDFAECWAHLFHIVDTLESVAAFGLSLEPRRHGDLKTEVDFDPYRAESGQQLIDHWVPLSLALNMFQRSMGQPDTYPFIVPPAVVEKLDFINSLIRKARERHAVGKFQLTQESH